MCTDDETDKTIREVAAHLHANARVLAITGAGISADSGLPTYRGIGGLYEDNHTEDAVPIEQALSASTFVRDPALTWKYIAQIEQACRGAGHNAAHAVLAQLEAHCAQVCVLTQNVDGFHAMAGSGDVIEMHGNLHQLQCTVCDHSEWAPDYSSLAAIPPCCVHCGALVRPRVVLFGEMLPTDAVTRYEDVLAEQFDVVMAIGTTAVFPYIASPVLKAAQRGATTVEINPGISELSSRVGYRIPLGAAQALTSLWHACSTAASHA